MQRPPQPPPTFQQLESVRLAYRAQLATLTFNSKPIINDLTRRAGELLDLGSSPSAPLGCGAAVVQAIEDHLANVIPKQKICFLYLIDSILKNVGHGYVRLFEVNMVHTFCSAFRQLDPGSGDRERFLRVLKTWRESSIFKPTLLAQLEREMAALAHAPLYPHAGPAGSEGYGPPPYAGMPPPPASGLGRDPRQQHIVDQVQALLLHKQRVFAANPADSVTASHIPILGQLLQGLQATALDPASLQAISAQLDLLHQAHAFAAVPPQHAPPTLFPMTSFPGSAPAPYAPSMPTPSAFLSSFPGPPAGPMSHAPPPGHLSVPRTMDDLPPIGLTTEDVQKPLPNAFALLYDTLPVQCVQCAARFRDSPEGKDAFRTHMDWHFRLNKRHKDRVGRRGAGSWRGWYIPLAEWLAESGGGGAEASGAHGSDGPDRLKAALFDSGTTTSSTSKGADVSDGGTASSTKPALPAIPAPSSSAGGRVTCHICKEALETFFDADQERWMLRDATCIPSALPGGEALYFHHACYEDSRTALLARQAAGGSSRASPSPLGLAGGKRKREEQGEGAASLPVDAASGASFGVTSPLAVAEVRAPSPVRVKVEEEQVEGDSSASIQEEGNAEDGSSVLASSAMSPEEEAEGSGSASLLLGETKAEDGV